MMLELRREPDNAYDPNAVAIYRGGVRLGYLPRAANPPVTALLDAGNALRAEIVGFLNRHLDKITKE